MRRKSSRSDAQPAWYRGTIPEALPTYNATLLTGLISQAEIDSVPVAQSGRRLFFNSASVTDVGVTLDSTGLTSTWSEFLGCSFTQRSRPTSPEARDASQGSFGNGPSLYRNCHFSGVAFRILGGYSMEGKRSRTARSSAVSSTAISRSRPICSIASSSAKWTGVCGLEKIPRQAARTSRLATT